MSNFDDEKELEQALQSLKDEAPTDLMMQKWKRAVRSEVKNINKREKMAGFYKALQLAAAMLLGLVVGLSAARKTETQPVAEKSFADVATFEVVYHKID